MSTSIGRQAEAVAAAYLVARGYRVLVANWRTRWCEIDLIVRKGEVIYFVEVKYRHTPMFGGGLEHITAQKMAQMHFAAELWLSRHGSGGLEYRLAALEVMGSEYSVTAWLDDVA